MSGTRVPEVIADFNPYITNTNNRLLATNMITSNPYWTDFNFTTAQKTAWGDQQAAWITLYGLYANPVTSTSSVKQQVKNFMHDFATFAQPLLDKIVASGAANEDDEAIFNVVLDRADPTHHTAAIPVECIASLVGLGRGTFEVHCKSATDQSRASIPVAHGADSVQYAYMTAANNTSSFNPDISAQHTPISTKAHFQLILGSSLQSQWLYISFRWYNTTNPGLAGPWSAMQLVAIG